MYSAIWDTNATTAQIKISSAGIWACIPHVNAAVPAPSRENRIIVLAGGYSFNRSRVGGENPLVSHTTVGDVEQSGRVVPRHRNDFHLLEHPSQVENGIVMSLLAESLFGVRVVYGNPTVFICQRQEMLAVLLLGEFASENWSILTIGRVFRIWENFFVILLFDAAQTIENVVVTSPLTWEAKRIKYLYRYDALDGTYLSLTAG